MPSSSVTRVPPARRPTIRRAAAALLAFALVLALPSLAAAQDEKDLAEAKAELSRTRDRIDATDADLDDVRARIEVIEDDLAAAEQRLAAINKEITRTESDISDLTLEALRLQETVASARERIREKARSLYTNGPGAPVMELFESTTAEGAIDRAAVVSRLADGDRSIAEQAEVDRDRLQVVSQELDERKAQLAGLQDEADQRKAEVDANLDEAEELRGQLQDRLDDLQGDEWALGAEIERIEEAIAARKAAEEAARRRAAAEAAAREAAQEQAAAEAAAAAQASSNQVLAATASSSESSSSSGGSSSSGSSSSSSSSGGMACPLSGVTLLNDWGAPRGGGTRSHEGNDLVGSYGQTVRAIVSGTWEQESYGDSAGIWGTLHGDDGNDYLYMHLDSHSVGSGARVSAGDQVGRNGWTGNAVGTVYHVHFEYHPGGGGPVDPYGVLSRAC